MARYYRVGKKTACVSHEIQIKYQTENVFLFFIGMKRKLWSGIIDTSNAQF